MRCLWLVLLLVWLALPIIPAQGAITRNSATSSACAGNPNPCTVAHTVAGADPFLAVCVAVYHYASTPSITAATWNGLALTPIDTHSNPSCGDKCTVALYGLANPGAATANVSITLSGSYTGAVIGAVSYNGVDATAPYGTPVRAMGVGSPASVTVPSNSGEIVMDCLGSLAAGSAPSVASGQTAHWSLFDGGGFSHGASSFVTGAPSTVSAWTISGTPQWAMLGLPIKPVGAGGGGGSTPGTQRVISWTDNSTNESCFRLQWQTDQTVPNWVDLNACLPPNTVSYAHNISNSTGDCYRLEATNAGGSSGFTDPVCAAGAPPPPPPPPPPPSAISTAIHFDVEEDLL